MIQTLLRRTFPIYFCSLQGLLISASLHAQLGWQKIVIPAFQDVVTTLQNPPAEYANTVTWGWDGPMSEEVIKKDLDSLYHLGFRAVTIEAGYGMPAPYLSEGWFELVKIAVQEAKKREMRVWIIDEGKYPSGFAGGMFSKYRPDLRMQALTVAEKIPVAPEEWIKKKCPPSIISAIALNTKDSSTEMIDIRSAEISWKAPKGNWQIILVQHQFKTSVTRAANNPTRGKDTTNSLCDYLNPAAVKQFLDFTHEQYKKYIGDEFGKTVLGFRGDEPDYAYLPWTPKLTQEFTKRKGYDIQPYIASFFLKNLSDKQKRAKADFWDVWSDLFADNFFKQQADWCAKNKLEYMVHLNHDDAMVNLVKSEGDFYKDFRSVQIPGIDVIWDQIWPGKTADFPKFASSAAHLFGRPRTLSESFAAFYTKPNLQQVQWIVNHQLVRGINLFEFMFFPSTANGKGGASGYMSENEFPTLMQYVNRTCYLLAQGRPAAGIAVYFPTSSLWLGHNESEKSTFGIAKQLLESQHDFDFIDEYTLTNAVLKNASIVNKSGQEYRTIIVPSVNTMSKSAWNRLQTFAKNGGKVIFTGERPSILPGKNFLDAVPVTNMVWAPRPDSGLAASLNSLPADVLLNKPTPELKYLHRKWKDADLYFFFNEGANEQELSLTVTGSGTALWLNTDNGSTQQVENTLKKGQLIQLPLSIKAYESKVLVIKSKN